MTGPKALFVKELKPNARRSLCADHLLPRHGGGGGKPGAAAAYKAARGGNCACYALILPRCRTFSADGQWKAIQLSGALANRWPAPICSGAPRGHRDLKAFARRFTQAQRRVLGCGAIPKPTVILPRAKPLLDGCCRRWIRSGWKPRCWTGKDRCAARRRRGNCSPQMARSCVTHRAPKSSRSPTRPVNIIAAASWSRPNPMKSPPCANCWSG